MANQPSRLDSSGKLIDVDRIVARGYHSDTLCSACDERLSNYETYPVKD